jgi:hypothetical protein
MNTSSHIAATTGGLYEALLDPAPDRELLAGAGGILAALACLDGPAKDMRNYPDAVPALHRFAEHAGTAEPTVPLLGNLLGITAFVADAGEFAWPDGEPARLRARYDELVRRPAWTRVTLAALAAPAEHGDHPLSRDPVAAIGADRCSRAARTVDCHPGRPERALIIPIGGNWSGVRFLGLSAPALPPQSGVPCEQRYQYAPAQGGAKR